MLMRERIFHAVLYEAVALLLFVLIVGIFTHGDTFTLTGLGIIMSLLAMVLNLLYNWVFDRWAGPDRAKRGFKLRALHATLFELSLIGLSTPTLMFALNMGFWEVLALDLGMVLFFVVYTFAFNWGYDAIRDRIRPYSADMAI